MPRKIRPVMSFIPPDDLHELVQILSEDKLYKLVERHAKDANSLAKSDKRAGRQANDFTTALEFLTELPDLTIPEMPDRAGQFTTLLTALGQMIDIEATAVKPAAPIMKITHAQRIEAEGIADQANENMNILKEGYIMAATLAQRLGIDVDDKLLNRRFSGRNVA